MDVVQGRPKPVLHGQNSSLTCSIMENPHTGLEDCPKILLLWFRARNSSVGATTLLTYSIHSLSSLHSGNDKHDCADRLYAITCQSGHGMRQPAAATWASLHATRYSHTVRQSISRGGEKKIGKKRKSIVRRPVKFSKRVGHARRMGTASKNRSCQFHKGGEANSFSIQ